MKMIDDGLNKLPICRSESIGYKTTNHNWEKSLNSSYHSNVLWTGLDWIAKHLLKYHILLIWFSRTLYNLVVGHTLSLACADYLDVCLMDYSVIYWALMRRNHRAIKAMARPFNAFPVTFAGHCFELGWFRNVQRIVYNVLVSRNEINLFIICIQRTCFNKAAPCSSQLWWMALCKTKGRRELLLMRPLWSTAHRRRLGVERLNAHSVTFENIAKWNKKDRWAFV